ncbi:ABC transporter permease subunit [Brucella rhizosphaerae]|uniref:ABC transporter permease subunit n=1 Tax=Brucella rhizosphaerae TaxID=571254 RepID=UPI00361840A3
MALFTLAAGLSFVIVIGGIDLSLPAVASLASVVTALLLPEVGLLAFPLALLCGVAAGLFSGLVHVRLKIPSFIATLATGGVVSGIALYISGHVALVSARMIARCLTGSLAQHLVFQTSFWLDC